MNIKEKDMKRLSSVFLSFVLLFISTSVFAGNNEMLGNKIKEYFNDMNQKVKAADNPAEKRDIMNSSFTKLTDAFTKLGSTYNLSVNDKTFLNSFKNRISEKYSELNGLNGYKKVSDHDLNKFADYVRQDMEIADKYVTISITTLLLIAIIVILLVR
jgi:hypothetical protein